MQQPIPFEIDPEMERIFA